MRMGRQLAHCVPLPTMRAHVTRPRRRHVDRHVVRSDRPVDAAKMSAPMPDVSIVIPVYNEEGILREAVTELLDGLTGVNAALHADLDFEVIIAENGSRDGTAELARHLAEERTEVRT